MMALLLEPLQFTFISHALLISLVVSIPCALLSVFLVLKGWALMGDAMSHAVFPGIVLAWILGLPLATGAFVAGVFCAVATGYLKDNSRIKQDTVMGIVFSGMFAAGLILYIAVKPDVHLDHILFGDMLGITIGDIIQTMIIAGLVTLVISVKWRDFLLFSFDYQQAQVSGLHTRWLHYGLLCMVSLTIVATLSEGALLKGCIAALLGMLISMIGMDPLSGNLRMTFDSPDLINGVSLVPALVGLYALSQVLVTIEDVFMGRKLSTAEISRKRMPLSEIWTNRAALLRGSIIGTFIGIVPATGSGTASFAAYSETKRHSKHPELFGKGTLEGIAATESANNAVTGGALIPLLTLGVPGDVVTAIMLGALMIQGMTPGPLLFQEQGTLVYSIFIALFVSNVFMLLLGYYAVRLFAKVVLIPGGILMPLVTTLCVVGGYALNNSNFDLAVMAGFGLLGYIMTKARFPLAPLLLAMILSGIIETNFRRALSISNQDFSVFFTRPVCASFLAISLFILFNLLWKEWKKYRAASAA